MTTCEYVNKNGKCLERRNSSSTFCSMHESSCNYINDSGIRCFRKCQNASFCKKHLTSNMEYNKECPICLEENGDDWWILSCYHKSHIKCLKGLIKPECPICRKNVQLSSEILNEINKNSEKYENEKLEDERREILNMLDQEFTTRRPPPQVEIIVALRYLYELGIPPFLIPETIKIHIDPSMALPAPGFIFQNTVKEIVNHIHLNSELEISDDEDCSDEDVNDETHTVRKILTVPIIPDHPPAERQRSYVDRSIFNTISFHIENLEIPQELYDLFMTELF